MKKLLRLLIYKTPKLKRVHNRLSKNKVKANKGNSIEIKRALLRGNHIEIKGRHNKLIVRENSRVYGCTIDINGDNNTIDVADNVTLTKADIKLWGDNNVLEIGEFTTFNRDCQIKVFEGTKIIIGKECMVSYNVDIRSSDGHPIFDKEGLRINFAKDIIIDDHVWIGSYANILKGATIMSGSVIGTGSLVTNGHTPPNVVLAGRPAEILKKDIQWQRKL